MSNGTLNGHVGIVTGASSGIGAGVARALAAQGANVVLAGRRRDRIEALAAALHADGGHAVAVATDVTDAESVAALVAATLERFGRIDSVTNSAGVMLSAKTSDATLPDWRAMIETNLLGLMTVSKAVLAPMRAQGSGTIVNISSISSRLANAGSPGYAATKAAVNAFSESLRKEGSSIGVRVTTILPGIVETELFEHLSDPATRERFQAMMNAMTPLTAADLGNAVVYALAQPPHVNVSELVIRPAKQHD